jgi:hypothetical protein
VVHDNEGPRKRLYDTINNVEKHCFKLCSLYKILIFVLQDLAILIGWGKSNRGDGPTSPALKSTSLAIYEYR